MRFPNIYKAKDGPSGFKRYLAEALGQVWAKEFGILLEELCESLMEGILVFLLLFF